MYPTSRKLNKGKRRQVRDLEAKLCKFPFSRMFLVGTYAVAPELLA